ncbi:hypothetical protein [Streptomyces sp. NPDC048516]|uniref:hypothetical protein n=1 Tax=Streptomyces sp. NPDC048516 TaxID=3365565 RepID=UPI00371DDAE2
MAPPLSIGRTEYEAQVLFGGDGPGEASHRLIGDLSERDRFPEGLCALLDGAAGRSGLGLPER